MTRTRLFLIAGLLMVSAVGCLILGVMQLREAQDVDSYVAGHYREYSRDPNGIRYECSGSPSDVADDIEDFMDSEARASNHGSEYLRYEDNIIVVGPDGDRACTLRVEDIDAGYSHGAYLFLGPGFRPGSPSGSAGGSPGGPDGVK